MSKKVIITGASGNLGRKLSDYLATVGTYDLRLFDLIPDPVRQIGGADFGQLTSDWSDELHGAEVVVHLAANADASARWNNVVIPNIDGLLNLYIAAARSGVKRIVLASSVWVLSGYRFKTNVLATTLSPDPGSNIYGATKLFAERVGKAFFEAYGLTTIVVRLGACRPGDNTSEAVVKTSEWVQDCWLSDRDMCQGLEAAINAPGPGFQIINLTSINPRCRWDLGPAARIGYDPKDRHVTRCGLKQRGLALLFRLGRVMLPKLINRFVSWHW